MGSRAVKRIEDVRVLRSAQFPEDSGPLAHPIRPDSYQEISNFYTATVYNKGAEVIRMMRTLAGPERFRKGTDLYFERHDGEAATCEDFITAMEDGAGLDLTQFRLWYSQAGTPRSPRGWPCGDTAHGCPLEQVVPPTPGQPVKQPMPIPLRLALFDRDTGKHHGEQLVVLEPTEARVRVSGLRQPPCPVDQSRLLGAVAVDADIRRRTWSSSPPMTTIPLPATRRCRAGRPALVAAIGGGMLTSGARCTGARRSAARWRRSPIPRWTT
jgi:aminopeptidase N